MKLGIARAVSRAVHTYGDSLKDDWGYYLWDSGVDMGVVRILRGYDYRYGDCDYFDYLIVRRWVKDPGRFVSYVKYEPDRDLIWMKRVLYAV